MSDVRKCPKCGGEMKYTRLVSYGPVRLLKSGDNIGDSVISFYCEKCGYVELYNEKILKKIES